MEQQYGEFVGVDSLYYARITTDTEVSYTTEAPEYLAPVAEIAGEPEINNKTTYYDNKAANNYVTEGKTELKITVSNVPARKAAILLGKSYDAASGRVYDHGEANPPDTALAFRYNMGKNGYRYYWYLKGTFSGGTEEAATKKEDIDEKTYELTFTAVTTTHEWDIDGELKSLKRIFADTSDAAFNPDGWFTQVQTPDTTGAPAALTLSSSNPLDEATDIAVNVSPSLVFNNKISNYAVTMIAKTTLTTVAATFSLDTTGKILTIDPNNDLTAATEYVIIASKVTDVYGQSLSDVIINFTTA